MKIQVGYIDDGFATRKVRVHAETIDGRYVVSELFTSSISRAGKPILLDNLDSLKIVSKVVNIHDEEIE
mgnify:CR=1 FL=1